MKKTIVLKVNAHQPEPEKIQEAAKIIQKGGLVAFPTETVYGLGADALNAKAVKKIFLAKKRPTDNPLIVHIADKKDIHILAKDIPKTAEQLIDQFWPGPLTLILKKSKIVPKITVAGLNTVAIRMPRHKVALSLIKESKTPIAAPSANLAGRPSPTTAQHVLEDLNGRIEMILDAGPTLIGVESTVVDLSITPPKILRPGGIPYEKLLEILGGVELHPVVLAEKTIKILHAPSPGMKHRHYAPKAELILVEGEVDAIIKKIQTLAQSYMAKNVKIGILATNETILNYHAHVVKSVGSREDLTTIARNLFRVLREFDEEKVDVIIAEGFPLKGLGLTIMNRLRKASGYKIVKT